MASVDENESTFTYQQVSAWRELLFDNRSLRIPVEKLSVWPLKRYLWALGTVGSSAPFVGLFGTVGGIITAFQKLSDPTKGGGGIGTVSAGIAEALITTAVGLGVAIIAVWFYNYFTARLDDLTIDIDETASELVDTILRGGTI